MRIWQLRHAVRPRRNGAEPDARPSATAGPRPPLFFRQIVGELRKVIWPTRKELVTYTVVCMAFVIFMVIIVTSLDYGFTKLVFEVFG